MLTVLSDLLEFLDSPKTGEELLEERLFFNSSIVSLLGPNIDKLDFSFSSPFGLVDSGFEKIELEVGFSELTTLESPDFVSQLKRVFFALSILLFLLLIAVDNALLFVLPSFFISAKILSSGDLENKDKPKLFSFS